MAYTSPEWNRKKYTQAVEEEEDDRDAVSFVSRRPMFSYPWLISGDILMTIMRSRKSGRLPPFTALLPTKVKVQPPDNIDDEGDGDDIDVDDANEANENYEAPRLAPLGDEADGAARLPPPTVRRANIEIVVPVDMTPLPKAANKVNAGVKKANGSPAVSVQKQNGLAQKDVDLASYEEVDGDGRRFISGIEVLELSDSDSE